MQHRTVQAVSGISGYLSSLAEDNPRLSSHLNKKNPMQFFPRKLSQYILLGCDCKPGELCPRVPSVTLPWTMHRLACALREPLRKYIE